MQEQAVLTMDSTLVKTDRMLLHLLAEGSLVAVVVDFNVAVVADVDCDVAVVVVVVAARLTFAATVVVITTVLPSIRLAQQRCESVQYSSRSQHHILISRAGGSGPSRREGATARCHLVTAIYDENTR